MHFYWIFGYAEHSKPYRFYVIEPNDSVAVHIVIESRDETLVSPNPKDLVRSSSGTNKGDETLVSPNRSRMLRRSKLGRIGKSFGPDFQIYLVEGSRYEIGLQHSYCYHIDNDPRTYSFATWLIDSIMGNNTWILSDLPPGCKPLGCKWTFKRKMQVDGIINQFKAQLVIQCFKQRECIDYFDTYAPVDRISSIRLLFDLAAINNLVVHQMDVKTMFLNGILEEEVYMKQPEGFIMPVMSIWCVS